MERFERNVREMALSEVQHVLDYFLKADHEFLFSLGVDPAKLPERGKWFEILREDFERPLQERNFFYLIWELNGQPVGHSHINDITFGEEAFMHLHLWRPETRMSGQGTLFVKDSLKIFFERYQLSRLFCQPYAENEAPNRTLRKVGFEFLKAYECTPSWINFPQKVNLWQLTRETFEVDIKGEVDHHDH